MNISRQSGKKKYVILHARSSLQCLKLIKKELVKLGNAFPNMQISSVRFWCHPLRGNAFSQFAEIQFGLTSSISGNAFPNMQIGSVRFSVVHFEEMRFPIRKDSVWFDVIHFGKCVSQYANWFCQV